MTITSTRRRRRPGRLRPIGSLAAFAAIAVTGWSFPVQPGHGGNVAVAGPTQQIVLPGRKPSPHIVDAAASAAAFPKKPVDERARETTVEVGPGDTMMALLTEAGVDRGEAFAAVSALKDVYSPRDLRPGQEIRLALLDARESHTEAAGRLAGLQLRAAPEEDVRLRRAANGRFVAKTVARDLARRVSNPEGVIEASLFVDGERAGVPVPVMLRMIRGFSYAVDFQRDLQPGDTFETLYETYHEAGGKLAKVGDLLYAALETRGKRLEMYRFETDAGDTDYFNGKGESVRRLLMRTPVNGARLSSGYGMRKHPILGYSRMHKGTDFAAPPGTPIYAAGSGVVEYAGRNGSFGNYIRIRHNGAYKTAYAHLRGLADGVHGGARVSQGEVIGYIGSSGSSTGPHLHYEIHKHGRQVNPRALELPTGYRLRGDELARFKEVKAEIDRLREDGGDTTRIANAACGEPTERAVETC